MKRALTTIGLSLAACMFAVAARAQIGAPPQEAKYFRIPHKFHIFVEFSGALPSSPGVFNDYWNTAFQFGAGGGVNILPWLDVNGNFAYLTWPNNATKSKAVLRFVGVPEVEGGDITTLTISGSARFVGVPSSRTNPFVEVAVGYFETSGDDLFIEGVLERSMENSSGMMVAPAVGIQYALADSWSAFAKYAYVLSLSDTFAPGNLLLPDGAAPVSGEDQVYQTIGVGIMLRF